MFWQKYFCIFLRHGVDQFQCGFHCFYRKKWAFQLCAEISSISLAGVTIFDGIGNFEKFSKTHGKVCVHDFDHLGAAYNKKFHEAFVAMRL